MSASSTTHIPHTASNCKKLASEKLKKCIQEESLNVGGNMAIALVVRRKTVDQSTLLRKIYGVLIKRRKLQMSRRRKLQMSKSRKVKVTARRRLER